MKQTYIKPSFLAVEINTQSTILAASSFGLVNDTAGLDDARSRYRVMEFDEEEEEEY